MIKVGIHENLVLSKIAVNDKGTMGIGFRPQSVEGPSKKRSAFAEAEEVSTQGDDSDSMLLLFPFKVPTFQKDGEDLKDGEKVVIINRDIRTFRIQLSQIIGAYRSMKDIKFTPWRNTGVTEDNYEKEILDNDTLKKAYDNYVADFMECMEPFVNDDTRPVRLKLVRQSKAKHYATFPSAYVNDNVFIEPMEVPKEASKIVFTKWEKDKGLDNGDPVSQATADPIPDEPPPAASGSGSVFGAR
jgi:hypothetical protein